MAEMPVREILDTTVAASMFLVVLGLGLSAAVRDLSFLWRHPGLLVRSVFSMNIVMLAFALLAAQIFALHQAVKITLIVLALSPVPPHLPPRQEKAGGSGNYALGLLSATSFFAIMFIPLVLEVLGRILGLELHMRARDVTSIVVSTAAAPLALGLLIGHFTPVLAKNIAEPVSRVAAVLLLMATLFIFVLALGPIWALVGNGIVLFVALFTVVGLIVGHLLGGPDTETRTVLALATATRHPGMALAIATANFPAQKAVQEVIVCYLISGVLFSALYVKWRSHLLKIPLLKGPSATGR